MYDSAYVRVYNLDSAHRSVSLRERIIVPTSQVRIENITFNSVDSIYFVYSLSDKTKRMAYKKTIGINDTLEVKSNLMRYTDGRIYVAAKNSLRAINPDETYTTMANIGSFNLGFITTPIVFKPGWWFNITGGVYSQHTGKKVYELKDHLGNVRAVITDRKLTTPVKDIFIAELVTASDYYAFGAPLCGRKYTSQAGSYRFGFNGKENDNEVKGGGSQQDYGMRIYDTRLGRFLSVDPLTKSYPMLTPYQFASNNSIQNIDLDGLEGVQYSITANVLGIEIVIKKVVEVDVYVAIGTGQYKIEDVEGIKNNYNKQYNNNFVSNTLGYSVPVEFVFTMQTFNSDKITPVDMANNLKYKDKSPDNFVSGEFLNAYPKGVVLSVGSIAKGSLEQGSYKGGLIQISSSAKNPKHTACHELGHALFNGDAFLDPVLPSEHDNTGGVFKLGKEDKSGNIIENVEDVNQDNIDGFLKAIPNVPNKTSGIEIKRLEQDKGL